MPRHVLSTSPDVTLFTEARLDQMPDGSHVSDDPNMQGSRWAVFLPTIDQPVLAARSRPVTSEASAHRLEGNVFALPYYVGLRQAVRTLPALFTQIDRAVRRSDVVVARLPGVVGSLAAFCAVVRRRPLAVEVVGDVAAVVSSAVPGQFGRLAARLAARTTSWCAKRAGAARYVTRASLQALHPPRPGARSVSVSGVSITTTALRPDLVVRGRVVAVGSQEQMYKGHDVLLRALAVLRAQGQDLHLQLVGQGRHHQHLRRLAADLGVQDHVTFIPVIATKAEMTDLLDTAEIFAMPSLTEGLPRVLIEAMARGAVCVGSEVGGIPELLDASVLCPVGDSDALALLLRRLHNDPDLRVLHSQRNLDRSRDFSEDVLQARRVAWSDAVKMLAGAR